MRKNSLLSVDYKLFSYKHHCTVNFGICASKHMLNSFSHICHCVQVKKYRTKIFYDQFRNCQNEHPVSLCEVKCSLKVLRVLAIISLQTLLINWLRSGFRNELKVMLPLNIPLSQPLDQTLLEPCLKPYLNPCPDPLRNPCPDP